MKKTQPYQTRNVSHKETIGGVQRKDVFLNDPSTTLWAWVISLIGVMCVVLIAIAAHTVGTDVKPGNLVQVTEIAVIFVLALCGFAISRISAFRTKMIVFNSLTKLDPLTQCAESRALNRRLGKGLVAKNGASAIIILRMHGVNAVAVVSGKSVANENIQRTARFLNVICEGAKLTIETSEQLGMTAIYKEQSRVSSRANKPPKGLDAVLYRTAECEFTIVLENFETKEQIVDFAKLAVCDFNKLRSESIDMSATSAHVGIAILDPIEGRNRYSDLLDQARLAADRAEKYQAELVIHSREITDKLRHRNVALSSINRTLKSERFRITYVPQAAVDSGLVVSFAAVMIPPQETTDNLKASSLKKVVMNTALSQEVDLVLLKQCCNQIQQWSVDGFEVQKLYVEMSYCNFSSKEFVTSAIEVLQRASIKLGVLCIDLNGAQLPSMGNKDPMHPKSVIEKAVEDGINEFKKAGVGFRFCGFEPSFSHIRHVRRVGFESLRMSFSQTMNLSEDESFAMGLAATAFARKNGLTSYIDGVESHEQLLHVRKKGIDQFSGAYLSAPMDAVDVMHLIAWRRSDPSVHFDTNHEHGRRNDSTWSPKELRDAFSEITPRSAPKTLLDYQSSVEQCAIVPSSIWHPLDCSAARLVRSRI